MSPDGLDPRLSEAVQRRRWWILAVLCLSLLMVSLDNTVVNVALPTLVGALHASATQLQWVVDAYTLVFASLLLTAGSFGDRVGRRGAAPRRRIYFRCVLATVPRLPARRGTSSRPEP